MRPLFFCLARPMKEEWKMSPYLGVLPLVFSALHARAGFRASILTENSTLKNFVADCGICRPRLHGLLMKDWMFPWMATCGSRLAGACL